MSAQLAKSQAADENLAVWLIVDDRTGLCTDAMNVDASETDFVSWMPETTAYLASTCPPDAWIDCWLIGGVWYDRDGVTPLPTS